MKVERANWLCAILNNTMYVWQFMLHRTSHVSHPCWPLPQLGKRDHAVIFIPLYDWGNWDPKTSFGGLLTLRKAHRSPANIHQGPCSPTAGIGSMYRAFHTHPSPLPQLTPFQPPCFPALPPTCQTPPASALTPLLVSLPGMSSPTPSYIHGWPLPHFLLALRQIFFSLWNLPWPTNLK